MIGNVRSIKTPEEHAAALYDLSENMNYSIIISILFTVYLFETTQAKVIGGVLNFILVMVLIHRFLRQFIIKYIQKLQVENPTYLTFLLSGF